MKHLSPQDNYIKECVQNHEIEVHYIAGKLDVAVILTKELHNGDQFRKSRNSFIQYIPHKKNSPPGVRMGGVEPVSLPNPG